MKKTTLRLHLGRYTNTRGPSKFRLTVDDVPSSMRVIECEMTIEQFADFMSSRPAEVDVELVDGVHDRIGKQMILKDKTVYVGEKHPGRLDAAAQEIVKRDAAEDGWVVDTYGLDNPRRIFRQGDDGYYITVTLRRWE